MSEIPVPWKESSSSGTWVMIYIVHGSSCEHTFTQCWWTDHLFIVVHLTHSVSYLCRQVENKVIRDAETNAKQLVYKSILVSFSMQHQSLYTLEEEFPQMCGVWQMNVFVFRDYQQMCCLSSYASASHC